MGTESSTEIGVIFDVFVVGVVVPRLLRGRRGAKARAVVEADVRHDMAPTAHMLGECCQQIAVVQVLSK